MMNQTRTFLVFALLAVAYLLFNQWQNDYHKPPAVASAPVAASSTPAIASDTTDNGAVPAATTSSAAAPAPATIAPSTVAETHGQLITVTTDVLRVVIDSRGGSLVRAELLKYPQKLKAPDAVRLLDDRASHYFIAQSGLISATAAAPDHRAMFQATRTDYTLAPGQDTLDIDLTWTDPSGIKVLKRYTVHRGSYVIDLDQRIDNGGAKAWTGNAYRQLQRVIPPEPTYSNFLARYSDQSRYSFFGAAWYSPEDKFEKLKFDKFQKEPLNRKITGGWEAMLQHYFVTAWIPEAKQGNTYSTAIVQGQGEPRYLLRSIGPTLSAAPGQQVDSTARLYLGPKLPDVLETVAPGFQLAVSYGMFTIIAAPLHWILTQFHKLTGNWGWAIILLVLLINAAIYKLSATQYRSAARMRKLKPRMDALKERYGDDKQKLQQATMELYKKEKVNPVAGCLPVLVTIPIFFGLYELLRESVELRQAPFLGWIHDLSAADPYFVLPILNMIIMFLSTHMMPMTPGMDPTQQKLMKAMPVISGVFFAFFPAGLVLYYLVNSICRFGVQTWVYHQVDVAEAKGKSKVKR